MPRPRAHRRGRNFCDAIAGSREAAPCAVRSSGNALPARGRSLPQAAAAAVPERHETVAWDTGTSLAPFAGMNTRFLAGATLLIGTTLLAGAAVPATATTPGRTRALPSIDGRSISRAALQAVRTLAGRSAATLSLTAAPLDPRLRLPACDLPLEAFVTGDGQVRAQTTVGVRCAGSVHWTIYTSITVESVAPVLTARYALPRDAVLTAADFQLQTRHVPGLLASYLSNPAALTDQRLRRPLSAGEPLSIDALAPAPLIRRGQQVVLVARGPGIEVRAAGVALSDGRASDHIRVQNLSSQRIVEGVVRSDSVVETPL